MLLKEVAWQGMNIDREYRINCCRWSFCRQAHFRDRYGLEVDLVVSLPDGRWGGVEVKLGSGRIDEAAMNLTKMAGHVDEKRMGTPSFLMVLTGTKFAFRRPDGVYVVPLGCLKP